MPMKHMNIMQIQNFTHMTHTNTHSHTSSSPLRYLEQREAGSRSGQWELQPGWAVRLTMPCSVLSRLGRP